MAFYLSMDAISWIAVLTLPIWIAGATVFMRALLDWTTAGKERYRYPIYMGVGVPFVIFAAGVPVALLTRQIDRSDEYESCVIHENAERPYTGCPDWTIRALNRARD